jgi:hypothetical protein
MWPGGSVRDDPVMASFLVETYVAQGDGHKLSIAVEALRAAIESGDGLRGPVRHVRSYLVPRDEMGVHVVEAESVEAVMGLARLAGIEVERIVAAIGVDPGVGSGQPAAGTPSDG